MIDYHYYTHLIGFVLFIVAVHYLIESGREHNAVHDHTRCSYCGKILHGKFTTMSYGIDGIARIFRCRRWWCRLGKFLGYLVPKDYNKEKN